jgi:hypothetical protein
MYKENKIVRIALSGGIIGALCTSPRRALDAAVRKHNAEGWNCRQVLPHSTSNVGILVLQLVCLICTCGLWTFGAGYLLLFERPLYAPGQAVPPVQQAR